MIGFLESTTMAKGLQRVHGPGPNYLLGTQACNQPPIAKTALSFLFAGFPMGHCAPRSMSRRNKGTGQIRRTPGRGRARAEAAGNSSQLG